MNESRDYYWLEEFEPHLVLLLLSSNNTQTQRKYDTHVQP